VFHNRVFEVLSITCFLVAASSTSAGRCGRTVFWTAHSHRWRRLAHAAARSRQRVEGPVQVLQEHLGRLSRRHAEKGDDGFAHTPTFFLGLLLLSLVTFALEVFGFWSIKQAFSRR
jgi:hypothetical protein